MSQSIIDGLREVGAKRVAVATAYTEVVEPAPEGTAGGGRYRCAVAGMLRSARIRRPEHKSEADIIALSSSAVAACQQGAEGILISCGGLRTLEVAKPLEDRHGLPVVSSATAAFWAAMRLVGESGRVSGYGRLLEQAKEPVH